MAKKAIILTLLKKKQELKPFALNQKSFSESNEYIKVLKRSLDKKGVIITNFFFINDANTFKLKLQVFFRSKKLKRYKKRIKIRRYRRAGFRRYKWRFFRRERKRLFRQERKNVKIAPWNRITKKLTCSKPKQKTWIKYKQKNLIKCKQKNLIRYKQKNLIKYKQKTLIKYKQKNLIKPKGKKKSKKKITKKRLFNIKANLSRKRSNFLAYKIEKRLKKKEKRTNAFKNITKFLPINNLLVHEFEVLNGQVYTRISLAVDKKLRSFKKTLFSRRITLYIDFLKITSLFITKKIKIGTYNILLGTIFRFLLKRSHSKFFAFLKRLFSFLIKSEIFVGIKICISGKLKGKLRAKSYNMIVGKISTQRADLNIDFSRIHIRTLYGCFGFKTLIKYKQTENHAIRSKEVKV